MNTGSLEKHYQQKVVGGALEGKTFGELTIQELKRAARKYPTDPLLRKFAKAKIVLDEMHDGSEPQPCAPLKLVPCSVDSDNRPVGKKVWKNVEKMATWALANKWVRTGIVVLCFVCLVKPPLSSLLGRYLARSVRLVFRRIFDLIALILESLLDEVIYQLDRLVREALPPDMQAPNGPQTATHLFAHLISALLGAGFSLITARFNAQPVQVA